VNKRDRGPSLIHNTIRTPTISGDPALKPVLTEQASRRLLLAARSRGFEASRQLPT